MTPEQAREIDLTHDGNTQAVSEWALDYGIPASLIQQRICRGWSVADAITTPMRTFPGDQLKRDAHIDRPDHRLRLIEHDGVCLSLNAWAQRTGIKPGTIAYRLGRGWSVEQALAPHNLRGRCRWGVVPDFVPLAGTGAGSTAQETPDITFQEEASSDE